MSIADRVQQALTTSSSQRKTQVEFVKLQEFYNQALETGIAKKPTYTLPPLDTAGHRLYQMTVNKQSR